VGPERPGDLQRGRARVQGDDVAVRDQRRRDPSDGHLLRPLAPLALLELALGVDGAQRGGHAADAEHTAIGLQCRQVLADGDLGDAQPHGEVTHEDVAALVDQRLDPAAALERLGARGGAPRDGGPIDDVHGNLKWPGLASPTAPRTLRATARRGTVPGCACWWLCLRSNDGAGDGTG
jgi:hypothetical protein